MQKIASQKAIIREMDAGELTDYIEDMQDKYNKYLLDAEGQELLEYANEQLNQMNQ